MNCPKHVVSCQTKFVKLVHLIGFIIKKDVHDQNQPQSSGMFNMLKVISPHSLKCSPTAAFYYVLHSQAAVIYFLVYLKALLAAQTIWAVDLKALVLVA